GLVALGRLLLPVARTAAAGFRDTRGHWAEAAIERLQAQGALAGFPDGSFRPDEPIRRVEAAVLFRRALALPPGRSLPYADADRIPPWAVPDVAGAAPLLRGVPGPGGGLEFHGDRRLTRAELAVV